MASSRMLSPSPEKVNFSRIIALLIDGGQLALRYQFDQHFPPSCLEKNLRKVKITLGVLKGRGIINDIQWNRLYPMSGSSVSTENFDISLLTCLLRNICGLNPPKTGWDDPPLQGDTSPEADIVRIRLLRNEIQHIPAASLSDQDFQTMWDEIEQVLTRLGSGVLDFTAFINKLKYDTWDPVKEKEYQDRLQVWMNSDKVLRDRIEDIGQRTSILEAGYKDLSYHVTQHTHNQETAIRRVESEVIYLRRNEEMQTNEITLRLETHASQIQVIEEKVTEIVRRPDIDPVLKNMHKTSVVWLRDMKKNRLINFTKTNAFQQAVYILKDKGVLILSGGPGEGKTTTAAAVLLHTSSPQRCLVVRSPDDWKHVDPLSFDVIFIDNMFGEININIELLHKWMPYLEDMWSLVREKKTSFIIALREHIFENCKPKLKRAKLFKPEFCHRLTSVDLSDEEKAKILEQYLLGRKRLLPKDYIYECVRNYSGLLGFPACAQLFATNDYLYSVRGPEFFKKPLIFLLKCLETLYGDSEEEFLPFVLLWIMHNRNQKVTKIWLSLSTDPNSILGSLDCLSINSRSLEKSYASHSVHGGFITYSEEDGSYEFSHPAVKDMVGMIVMHNYPLIALQECKFEFIMEYLCVTEPASDELKYRVEPWLYSCLADRFIQHATESFAKHRYSNADVTFSWLENEILEDKTFISLFVKRVKEVGKLDEIFGFGSRYYFRKFYGWGHDDDNVSLFAYALCPRKFAPYTEIENVVNVHFAEQIMHLGVLDEVSNKEFIASQKTIALLFGLRSRKLPLVNEVIQSGVVVDSNCLCMAVYQSYFDIVKIFIENLKVDINGKAERMNSNTALCIAAKTGDRNMVMYLIKHGASINVTDTYNVSPLGRALMNLHEDVAEILIDHGADVSLKMSRLEKTPLHLSAGNGMRNIVQVLLEKGGSNINVMDRNKVAPLGIAIMNMHEAIGEYLINHGADIFIKMGKLQQTPLHLSSDKGMDNIVKILLEKGASSGTRDRRGRTPLHCASINGHTCIVNILLQHDRSQVSKRDRRGHTPLHYASMNGHADIVNIILKNDRSQVNKRAFCNTKKGKKGSNVRGFTALHYAASQGYVDSTDVVLEAGGEVNMKDSFGQTPLYVASSFGHLDVVRMLVSKGANLNFAENHGFTPLHVAVYRQRTDVVKFLADRATIDALDMYGKTPLHVACQKGYTDIVKILLSHNSNWRLSTYTDNTVLHYACRYGHADIAEEFAKRDKEMLYVENARISDDRKVPFQEALLYDRQEVVTMLQSMQMPHPNELPREMYVSETNNERKYRNVIKQE